MPKALYLSHKWIQMYVSIRFDNKFEYNLVDTEQSYHL